jgi:two-component system chemotaxis response regulator CheB
MSKIKILLVDDSSLVRKILKSLFKNDNQIEVADEAPNGKVALEKVTAVDFDMVLLDYEMPEMNGLEFLQELRRRDRPTTKPSVIVFSALTGSGSKQTIDCLLAGAKDYIQKPSAALDEADTLDKLRSSLREKIISIVGDARTRPTFTGKQPKDQSTSKSSPRPAKPKLKNLGLVLIGSSTGGPNALEIVLKAIPSTFRFPILIVQHMPESFTKILAETLSKNCSIKVEEVSQKTVIKPGHAYIAAGGKHMLMIDQQTVDSIYGPAVNFCTPSVDVLFESVSKIYKKSVVAIILTGMGKDGADGVKMLKDNLDCFAIAQDAATSVVWAMPKALYEGGLSDCMLPVNEIGEFVANV